MLVGVRMAAGRGHLSHIDTLLILLQTKIPILINRFVQINPSLAKHDMPCLSKQLLKKQTDLDLHCCH